MRARIAHVASPYVRRIRRIREAPASFLAWKVREAAISRLWSRRYARAADSGTSPSSPSRAFLRACDPFARAYAPVATSLADRAHLDWVLARAQAAKAGRVQVLGFGELDFGAPINWSLDAAHGVEWGDGPGLQLPLVPGDLHGDIKVPWELNRLQFVTNLAQAHLLTGEQAYVDQTRGVLKQWRAANPVGLGVAWSCAMEVAIRGMNLVATFAMVWPELGEAEKSDAATMLQEHLDFLRRHPERSDISGNHYLVDLGVTLQLALVLGQGDVKGTTRRDAERFFAEVRAQFAPDGMHFEFATNYHRYMTELVLLTVAECDRFGLGVPPDVRSIALRAADVCQMLAGGATLPLIGDCDSGEFLVVADDPSNDPRRVRELARAVGSQAETACLPAVAWMLAIPYADRGPAEQTAPVATEVATVDGFGVLQRGSAHLVVRAGAPGLGGRGGHDHSDLTSPVLRLGGRDLLVDPGTWTYTYSRSARLHELAAAQHNMLLVEGDDPSPAIEGSVMPTVSINTSGSLRIASDGSGLVAGHDGWSRGERPVAYERTLSCDETGTVATIVDSLKGEGRRGLHWSWHLAPGLDAKPRTDSHWDILEVESGLVCASMLVQHAGPVTITCDDYWFSAAYGSRVLARVLRVRAEGELPSRSQTTFEWRDEHHGKA
ncbi:MAG: heparinase II/III family protein [Nocardioides sp.]|jgi:hypothetical protein